MRRWRFTMWITVLVCVALGTTNALGDLSETLVLKATYSVPQWGSQLRSIAFDGSNIWTSQDNHGWSSRIYRHNMDATLSVAEAYASSSTYLTEMTFVNGALWTSDNMTNQTVRYAVGDPTSEVARYGQPGLSDGAHGITFDGSAFWLVQHDSLARVDYPAGNLLGTWHPGLASTVGVEWDSTRNRLWVLDANPISYTYTILREYSFSGGILSQTAAYDISASAPSGAAGLLAYDGDIWTCDYTGFKILQFELQPVPVPGAAILGAIGLGFSGLLCRRKSKTLRSEVQ